MKMGGVAMMYWRTREVGMKISPMLERVGEFVGENTEIKFQPVLDTKVCPWGAKIATQDR